MNVVPVQLLSERRCACPQSVGIAYFTEPYFETVRYHQETRPESTASTRRLILRLDDHAQFCERSRMYGLSTRDMFSSADEDTLV